MSTEEQDTADDTALIEQVKVEITVDDSTESDMSDFAEEEGNGLNLTLTQHVKVGLSTGDEYGSGNKEKPVIKEKRLQKLNNTYNVQVCKNMEDVSVPEQINVVSVQEGMLHHKETG
jgi:hypothetical protein